MANQQSQLKEFTLIDTPGIDADEADTAEAERTLKQADLILFVHNVKAGELDRVELAFMRQLRQFFPDTSELKHRILPVFSRIDEVDSGDATEIIERSLQQWEDLLEFLPEHQFKTSSKRYFTGIEQNKPIFVQKSGIEPLREFLQDQAGTLRQRRATLMAGRVHDRMSEVRTHLAELSKEQSVNRDALAKQRRENRERLEQRAKEMFGTLEGRARAYLDMPTGDSSKKPAECDVVSI